MHTGRRLTVLDYQAASGGGEGTAGHLPIINDNS